MMAPERPGPEDEPTAGAGPRGGGCAAPAPAGPPADLALLSPLVLLKEGDGASDGAAPAASLQTAGRARARESDRGEARGAADDDDHDLTSLTWLQDRNLLKGMKLSPPIGDAQESPTSDFVDDSTSDPSDTLSSGKSPSPAPHNASKHGAPLANGAPGKHRHPQHMPYDPLVHINSKPPYSFSCLIFMAIEDSPQRALPVKEIYAWILEHFPYFKNAPTGWKNSVRHNLSLNKCFRKVEKAPNLGKGSLWMVDPTFRPNLLQALQKAPFHPRSALEKIAVMARTSTNSNPTVAHSRNTPAFNNSTSPGKAGGRLPDPELFPYLSRRLAASGVDITPVAESESTNADGEMTDEADSLDDVDAATAMLALKHGPRLLAARKVEWYKRPEEQNGVDAKKKTSKLSVDSSDGLFPVITTSPSEDHTYSAGSTTPPALPASSSPDEAYGEGSTSEDNSQLSNAYVEAKHYPSSRSPCKTYSTSDAEEQRKIAEGADALLNLAGITTRKRSLSMSSEHVPPPVNHAEETTPVIKRSPSTRGRRRGGGLSTSASLSRVLWPAGGRQGKRRLEGLHEGRRSATKRRSSLHNNNHIHAKHAKTGRVQSPSSSSSSPSSSPSDQRTSDLRKPPRLDEKGIRTRR